MRPQIPVTALAVSSTLQGHVLLLSGEGANVRIFDYGKCQLLHIFRVPSGECVHGLAVEPSLPDGLQVLAWSSRSVWTFELQCNESDGQFGVTIANRPVGVTVEDWVLHAVLTPNRVGSCFPEPFPQAFAVNAHNQLISLHLRRFQSSDPDVDPLHEIISAGPPSFLYSAHVVWTGQLKLLIAAGTVFGDVLLWTVHFGNSASNLSRMCRSRLLCKFSGHEGSIFGVRLFDAGMRSPLRWCLASCSDDRTIRIWDTTQLFEEHTKGERAFEAFTGDLAGPGSIELHRECGCLVSVVGHASRIWAVRFQNVGEDDLRLFSFGEDATSVEWKLSQRLLHGENCAPRIAFQLNIRSEHCLHQGKNLWAAELFNDPNGPVQLVTGGGDGCIAICRVCQSAGSQGWAGLLPATGFQPPASSSKPMANIFSQMQGSWTILRSIRSYTSSYPSGTFNGRAKLESRLPTDPTFDSELLYHEEGIFTMDQGMSFPANRSYVYRFEIETDRMTAWFTKSDDKTSVDYLFHQVNTNKHGDQHDQSDRVTAVGHHLCVRDDYDASYTFQVGDCRLNTWTLSYKVKGPTKDYVSSATYTRITDFEDANETPRQATRQQHDRALAAPIPKSEQFKAYCWTSPNTLVATASDGRVLVGAAEEAGMSPGLKSKATADINVRWRCINQLEDLRSYSTVAGILPGKAFLGSASGQLYLFDGAHQTTSLVAQLGHKIAGIFVHSAAEHDHSIFATVACLEAPCAFFLHVVTENSHFPKQTLRLSLSSKFIVTSAGALGHDFLVLGSRSGALALYDLSSQPSATSFDAVSLLSDAHGKDAVTSIHVAPASSKHSEKKYLLTAGRDSTFAMHYLFPDLEIKTVHRSKPSFGPNVEDAMFGLRSTDLVLWGFSARKFVAWSATERQKLLNVDTGGCHRNWSYLPGSGSQTGGRLVWTKASQCHVHIQPEASHRVFQRGGHGRDVKAVALRPAQGDGDGLPVLIATGAEDTNVRISKLEAPEGSQELALRCVGVLSDHTAGIQALRWSLDGRFLFSAGGREEFMVWRVQWVPCLEVGALLVARASQVTKSGHLRVMDIDVLDVRQGRDRGDTAMVVAAVYSDSTYRVSVFAAAQRCHHADLSVQLWAFSTTAVATDLRLLHSETYRTNCLTHCSFFTIRSKTYLATASTDGHVAFWDIPSALLNKPVASEGPSKIQYVRSHRLHQSSIKAFHVTQVGEDEVLLVSGGDDNAIAFTRVQHDPKPFNQGDEACALQCSALIVPRAHAAAINAVVDVSPRKSQGCSNDPQSKAGIVGTGEEPLRFCFATTGNDQVVKSWGVALKASESGTEGLDVRKGSACPSEVADASCMDALKDEGRDSFSVFVAGMGVEMLRVHDSSLTRTG